MSEWHDYWYFPMALAGIIFVLFALFFWDKVDTKVTEDEVAKAASPDEESAV